MFYEGKPLKYGFPPIVVFIPFGTLAVNAVHAVMPFKWVALFTALQILSILSFYTNFMANDYFWCLLALGVYVLIVLPVYVKISKKDIIATEAKSYRLNFHDLFGVCAKAFFSDYRLSLLSKIPLALQVLVGGSLLYGIFGADWMLHGLAGFGIGIIAMKAYTISVNYYGYIRLASYFHIDKFRSLRYERKYASAEFTLFSVVVIALIWEFFEGSVHYIYPVNVFRVGEEPAWNVFGDVFFAVIAGMIAWYLLNRKVKWL
jgi:hypothetical protein